MDADDEEELTTATLAATGSVIAPASSSSSSGSLPEAVGSDEEALKKQRADKEILRLFSQKNGWSRKTEGARSG